MSTAPRDDLLTALAGVAAVRQGMNREAGRMGYENPEAFAAACALADWMGEEVRRLGGDPDEVLARARAAAMAPVP